MNLQYVLFNSISVVQDDGRVCMNGSVQWRAVCQTLGWNTDRVRKDTFLSAKVYFSASPGFAPYCKFPKYSDTWKICCNHSKIWTMWLYHRVMSPNDADGMANSLGAVWYGSALFAQAYLSENLGSLRYTGLAWLKNLLWKKCLKSFGCSCYSSY